MSLCFMLTAGLGTRLRPFTETKPKPCLPFLNLPLMYYGFYLAKNAGFDNFLFNKHHLPDALEKEIHSLQSFGNSFQTSDETSQILGSGGAIKKAAPLLKEHDYFLIANGDEVLIPEDPNVLASLVSQFKTDQSLCTLLTCDHPDLLKTLKPVWVNEQRQVRGFGLDKPDEAVKPVHYTGYKVFSKRILNFLPDGESNIFYDILIRAISQDEKVSNFHLNDCRWYETGNFQSFLSASQEIATQKYEKLQEIHEFFGQAPHLFSESNGFLLTSNCYQRPAGLVFKGFNTIHPQSKIEDQVNIENVFIHPEASIKAQTSHQNTFLF